MSCLINESIKEKIFDEQVLPLGKLQLAMALGLPEPIGIEDMQNALVEKLFDEMS